MILTTTTLIIKRDGTTILTYAYTTDDCGDKWNKETHYAALQPVYDTATTAYFANDGKNFCLLIPKMLKLINPQFENSPTTAAIKTS